MIIIVFGISAMQTAVGNSILRGRPFGGVASMIRNKGLPTKCIVCSEHYNIVTVGDLAMVNVYLPTCINDNERDDILVLIDEIASHLDGISFKNVIFGGDMNCDMLQKSMTADLMKTQLYDNEICLCNY